MIRLRHFGPAMTAPTMAEAIRAALGAGVGLLACNLILWLAAPAASGLFLLIAPFGATAFLIFVVPNSPLAQPWSVVAGNTLAALAALVTLALAQDPLVAAPAAIALAILGMAAARAFHPPAGAVALATVISAQSPAFSGWTFALSPVLAGSAALVATGILWNRATGRVYPFRQPPPPSSHGTADPAPDRRLGLAPADLAHLLDRLRMSPNIGVEDLARVLSAAGTEAAAHHLGHLSAADIMSRDLVTAAPTDSLQSLAAAFRTHRFKTLPLSDHGHYAGLIDQSALLGLTDPATTAADLAAPVATLPPDATAADLMDLLADGRQQAVPILDGPRLAGLVTRSDLIALLSARLRDS
ncbi:HPP family protein [Rhodobacteraceae bacterium HSP-20]|uniref:HPP family protein n=1 Tax=Paragemmobacter amnigenus TaxID=2852097 RepID=A0ABS6J1Y9_9RHOB|nr:HPP family protein [Rhodobacter amnigenus]MBU9697760.1 HPP family protein [Rhodobacter amnigenus]MBV4388987.1 HPP family protein [Rhodobacter amnigenus]